ncbi:YbaK/EbsC family protein [Oryzibacter oryziterrae]|uniref:YbaK/EbsC family protein n=1 Tax=Oryzibacter oryziterrae TaxID=2766474 RepID=UPI001F42CB0F|nr:YbaK/EbsC family protein [Oryzibacter oryziterrae]
MSADQALPDACLRVLAGATERGLSISIKVMADSTKTAEDAAAACGCTVAQIAKSLVFVGRETRTPYLLLVSGINRVNEDGAVAIFGEALDRPKGAEVRAITGFAIGGIPPLGHVSPLKTYIDEHLMSFDVIWAAAGTPNAVFQTTPADLLQATQAIRFVA